ncbi:ATP-binding protein [Hydrogenovibrio halophilus]|uniref:ATP-binding protein n=1 Tax=Hydrogenovibrio halophilus TaxID=373391 RepID=UPI00035D41C1|nr:ATP-binding protein [Hydrogenovibrio halophilus]
MATIRVLSQLEAFSHLCQQSCPQADYGVVSELTTPQLNATDVLLFATREAPSHVLQRLQDWQKAQPQLFCLVWTPELDEAEIEAFRQALPPGRVLWLSRLPTPLEMQQWLDQAQAILSEQEAVRQANEVCHCGADLLHALFCVIQFDADQKIVSVNPHTTIETGWEASQLIGRSINEVVLWSNDRTGVTQYFANFEGETRYFNASGEQRWALAQVRAKTNAEGETHYFWVAKDITEQKKQVFVGEYAHFQEGLSRAKKELVHDLGNTLNSMNATRSALNQGVDQLQETLHLIGQWLLKSEKSAVGEHSESGAAVEFLRALQATLQETLSQYFEKTNRALATDLAGLIETLNEKQTDISRAGTSADMDETVNVYSIVQNLRQSCQAMLDAMGIRMHVYANDTDKACFLQISRSQLYQALMNLVKNATEALEISHKTDKTIRLKIYFDREGRYVIEVQDTAEGIPRAYLNQIYNDGFTTKPKGTGQGLPSVANFVNAHQGRIEVQSSYETGTTFRVILPAKIITNCSG